MAAVNWPTYESYKQSGVEWIGDVPREWGVRPLKYGMRLHNGRDHTDVLADEGYPVYGSGGKFAAASDYLYDGDAILLGRKGTIDRPLHASGKFWTVDTMFFAVCNQTLLTRFAYYCCTTIPFSYFSTSTALPSMTQDDLKNCPLVLPPVSEQAAIAAFLDEKCAKVDEAVRIKEEQIALLRERRQTLIQKAVTRGLNPDAPMKNSGIDWLGEIPAHWEVENPKWLFRHRKERARKGEQQLAATQKYGVIPQSQFMEMEGRRVTQVFLDFDILKHVEAGDFVMSMRSFQGGLEYSEHTGCVSSAYVALEPGPRIFAPFYRYLFKSTRYIEALQSTSNLVRDGQALRFDNFAMVMLPALPIEEQMEIAEFLDGELLKSDAGISVKENQIAALKEYKTTLINAAVTGKIMVA